MPDLLHEEITQDIIGAAMAVLNVLKPGLTEKIYERALIIELKSRGRRIETQKQFPVFYAGQQVGLLQPDLIVDGVVLVETKVVESFNEAHQAQLLGYLAITELRVGLLINFRSNRLQWKRIIR